MKSDIQIAQEAELKPIQEIAAKVVEGANSAVRRALATEV